MSDRSHYFDPSPQGEGTPRRLSVELQGRRVDVRTASGVFSGDRVDLGTQVLLRHAGPVPPTGEVLDLGCGWGPITLALAAAAPAARVWAVDVNERARALTAANARDNGFTNVTVAAPQDVPADLRLDLLWSNPPIRIGKDALHELLLTWLPRLAPAGRAELVVQRHLGADSLHRWLQEQLPAMTVTRSASSKGYRVLVVERPLSP